MRSGSLMRNSRDRPIRKLVMGPYVRARSRKKSTRRGPIWERLPPINVPFGPGGRALCESAIDVLMAQHCK